MIAKVLWQTWLNWCAIKIIYTTSAEQHLGYALWNWKRSLLESQPPRRGSHVLGANPEPSNCLVWVSPSSCPTYLQRRSASSCIYLYQLSRRETAGDSGGRCLGALISLSSSKGCAAGEVPSGVRGKAFGIGGCRISEQDLALDIQVHKRKQHFTSSLFSQVGSAHHWGSNVTFWNLESNTVLKIQWKD